MILDDIKSFIVQNALADESVIKYDYDSAKGEDFWFQKVTYFKEQKCYMDKEPVLVAASKFENVLAELTIELIKSNELDKAEVKRILEDE